MKKLLAMILCVAMVLSLAPAAFAGSGSTGGKYNWDEEYEREPNYISAGAAKKAVSDLTKDMKAMYYAIAADETVFGTAKGIYDMTNGMAKELLKDTDKLTYYTTDPTTGLPVKHTIYQEDLIDNVRSGFNHIIGDEIANYLTKHSGSFTDDDNHIKPEKYMNTFVKAVNEALTSNKAQKNIQALVYGLAALNLQKSVNDRADDLYDEIVEWDHWKEFYWTNHIEIDEETGDPIIVADQVTKPHDAVDDYTWMWMPTDGETNTVLAPTGSDNTAADSILSNAMLLGLFS
jgi:hypothetical protein